MTHNESSLKSYYKNREKRKATTLEYYHKNKEQINTNKRKQRQENPDFQEREKRYTQTRRVPKLDMFSLKQETFSHYGNICLCCKENNLKLLTLDHIDNDGYKLKNKNGKRIKGYVFYSYLKKQNFPTKGLQVLCLNCNVGKQNNDGICPHKE